jgi:hypothetical protein
VTLRNCADILGLKTWRRSLSAFFVGVVTAIAAMVGISAPANAGLGLYPLGLDGKIHVLLTEKPWSTGADSGNFGGFHTTGTLELHFKSSHGELLLSDHSGWILPFTLTQTIPAGLSGTCTAMWPFVNEHITGSVGGFSGSSVKESATVSLGFLETVVGASGTGCGANLEETTHPFGEEPGRLDIPIQSRGTYEHGDLTLRSTSKEVVAGGTLVVRIDGTLHD